MTEVKAVNESCVSGKLKDPSSVFPSKDIISGRVTSPTIPKRTIQTLASSKTRSIFSSNSQTVPGSISPIVLPPLTPSMASKMSFADWRQASNESLMATAETLLDKLEGVAELLTEIDDKYITEQSNAVKDTVDDERASVITRFHEGVDSARGVVGMLKREKWRLNKREMSVELRMGELEEYKSHLRNDMSSLNQTVDALSMRVVQLENQLVDALEVQESLEAENSQYKEKLRKTDTKISALHMENESLRKEVKIYRHHTSHTLTTENEMLKNEVLMLQDENHRLKELVRSAETHKEIHNETDGDYLSRLTNDFLRELSSLEVEKTIHGNDNNTNNNNNHILVKQPQEATNDKVNTEKTS